MTDKEKDLLLKDLSARIPYDVKCKIEMWEGCDVCTIFNIDSLGYVEIVEDSDTNGVNIERIKPYLFPLSSMTEEQKKEYASLVWFNSISEGWHSEDAVILEEVPKLTDFYHKNHFDYRGLIPKGLAIDCTNLDIY